MKPLIFLALIFINISANATTEIKLIETDTTEIVENTILYKVFSDSNYMHLNISTTDKKTIMSILRKGLTIYFDIKGKQKKDVYIKYPYSTEPRPSVRQNQNESRERDSIDLNSIIENIPKEAEYGYHDEKQQFHKDLNTQDIFLGYEANGELLEFSLKIPLHKISNDSKVDFSKLSIGVLANKLERNSENKNKQYQSQGNRRGGGSRQASGTGQGGAGRGRGNGQAGGRNKGGGQRSQTEQVSVDFWFDANLIEK